MAALGNENSYWAAAQGSDTAPAAHVCRSLTVASGIAIVSAPPTPFFNPAGRAHQSVSRMFSLPMGSRTLRTDHGVCTRRIGVINTLHQPTNQPARLAGGRPVSCYCAALTHHQSRRNQQ